MIIAIDIGSQALFIAHINKNGQITHQAGFDTPPLAQDCLDLIKATIASDFSHQSFEAIVVGISGSVIDNIIQWGSNLGDDWINFDFKTALENEFQKPTLIENDANLGGLAEAHQFAQIPQSLVYLNIGAGIGSSVIADGKLVPALLNSEAGMTMLEYDGVTRKWEDFASGRAIYLAYNQLAKDIKSPDIWDAIADRISRGLLTLIPVIQPNVVVIGGIMGNYFTKYSEHLIALIDEKLPPELNRPRVIAAKNPDSSVINGCYYLYKYHASQTNN